MSERDFELVVTCVEQVAKEVLRLSFARKDGAELPAWEAGAHVDLRFEAKGVEYVRQYSLCGRPGDRRTWQVAVLLVANGRGGSAHIHEALTVGDTVRVAGPRNNFALAKAKRYLFIAGGIGITPILAMLEEATASGADWRLVYCGRSSETMAFKDDVVRYGPERVVFHESGKQGKADLDKLVAETDPETAIYCCGPESMLQAIDHSCAAHQRNAHMERFSASGSIVEGESTAFEVEFSRSGIVLTVPEDRSILEMAEDAGIDIDSSCQEGVCGSCETRVISGTPDHRCSVLGAKERAAGKTMMVCVSRSCSARLVLDA
ncbi:PDR/VanB family oxidoreductase [Sinorhizobium fredii]|uniref:FAD/NAD-binding ferredoxin reductase-type protein n=1 Tax=Rhizobium fredii TaxID=380 RepID=A0A2L0HA24_RHIFR|nr:PDR/VanB family oxidoreductase [Sinorhizobium fredii]AUX78348.1 FAD/NAD-binding ferredoxin reductase-type protein [Sinorhizobium fredii]